MLTLKLIRDDKDFVINRLKIKNFDATELVEKIIACDDRRKECQFTKDNILKELNNIAKQVGQLFAQGKKDEAEQAKSKTAEMKEQVRDFDPQSVITKDNVTMQIDTVVYFQITDPKTFAYGIENPIFAIENLSATTLRNIIGDLDLDETLTSRDIINSKMRQILDEATDPWGIKVNRVEVKNILPPKDIRDAMEKQMRAERERREAILKAEGEKQSAILIAEGEKESAILRSEGSKQQMIKLAEGEKEKLINLAQGRAEALRIEKEAEAAGIKLVKEAGADSAVLSLKAMEALTKVADGKATKIIVPSEIQNLSGVLSAAKAVVEKDEKAE